MYYFPGCGFFSGWSRTSNGRCSNRCSLNLRVERTEGGDRGRATGGVSKESCGCFERERDGATCRSSTRAAAPAGDACRCGRTTTSGKMPGGLFSGCSTNKTSSTGRRRSSTRRSSRRKKGLRSWPHKARQGHEVGCFGRAQGCTSRSRSRGSVERRDIARDPNAPAGASRGPRGRSESDDRRPRLRLGPTPTRVRDRWCRSDRATQKEPNASRVAGSSQAPPLPATVDRRAIVLLDAGLPAAGDAPRSLALQLSWLCPSRLRDDCAQVFMKPLLRFASPHFLS